MRIAILTTSWGPPWNEGVRNLARSLSTHLTQTGDEVVVLRPRSKGHTWNQALFLLDAWRSLRSVTYDAAFWFTSHSPWFPLKLRLLRSSRVPVLPYVTGLRSVMPRSPRRNPAGPILVITPFFRERYFPDSVWVPPFLPRTVQRPADLVRQPPQRGEPRRILFLGAFEAGRGVETLIRAVARLDDSFHLTLAWNGVGAEREPLIRSLIASTGIEARTRLARNVDVTEEYLAADALVIPRQTEARMAFPVRIIEAAHLRLPMIVSDILGMPQVIGDAGATFPPGNDRQLAAALRTLLTDPDTYRSAVEGCAELELRCRSETSLTRAREELQHVANCR